MNAVPFQVGNTYENEKGIYEVLSLDERNDAMAIKWESGEEVTTTIALQRGIIERRRFEFEAATAVKKPRGRKPPPVPITPFEGFDESDFSGSVAGTTWRTQKALGGNVAAQLAADGPQVDSWAVFGMPEVHWMDLEHPRDHRGLEAKLFVRLDKEYLYYGFDLEGSDEESGVEEHWQGFVEWLSDEENESWLKEIAGKYDLCIEDRKEDESAFDGQITVADECWCLKSGADAKNVESLATFLKELSPGASVDFQIVKITGKDDTIARGDKIAGDISGLFEALMPLYKAATLQWTP
ncbi:MAG: hypothetical protein SWQ30_16540 [Thermodesulfobacteriota bacterium]|nr:hypothetical protein [Thermodesulfobacteriota bacterium]